MRLRIATYNIHKGVMGLRKPSLTIHALREQIHAMNADLVFLQEVQGRHDRHAGKFEHWPEGGQHEFLAQSPSAIDNLLGHASQQYFTAYGMNAVYSHGHHGNALLSRYEIEWMLNQDVSDHRLEQRGLLHCCVKTPAGPIHAMVAHFGLLYRSRVRQASKLIEHVGTHVPAGMPLVVAGDFNDWQRRLGPILQQGLQAEEVMPLGKHNRLARVGSFPSRFPLLGLDRVFARGFKVHEATVLHGSAWAKLSDHAPFVVDLECAWC
ncbi:MAG: endonuclease/exonuclease/phosphatase family protein [Gammaproteobacteria bacterium]|uniref:endonuclease/exonuclease/phosphatase family protein n=1 Tax=Limnobacter olei TaxID=3031298 RepID=UPI0023B1137B|nr:endonuclease/exonuclease/phosphatase family protein [Limnobacter sp. P1]MBU0542270.1 endonuclease/exonuclease/phosphatase family protein [Gammaproteobacteria bacterium]